VLRGYLQDKLNARLMGVAPTGNGRRESFAHMTLPRMTNTYMLAGKHDPQEILGSVQKGLYCKNFGGGQVDITSGKFVFSASEAYLIEKGKPFRQEVSMAKHHVANMLWRITDRAIQVHGALGYSRNIRVERLYRDARMFTLGGGTTEALRNLIGARILKHVT